MVTSTTNTTVILSWMSPDSPNGIITRYRVRYRRGDGVGGDMAQDITQDIMNSVLNYTVTGLTMGIEYEFEVRASTGVGNGPYSNSVIVRPGKLQLLLYV